METFSFQALRDQSPLRFFVFVITETSFFKFLFLYNITKKIKNNNVNGLGMNLRKIGENLNKKIYLKNISC